MKKKTDDISMILAIIGLIVAALLALAFVCADDVKADGLVVTRDGWENVVSLETDIECDSALAIYCDTVFTAVYDTVHLYPYLDSTKLIGTGLSLDSIGKYGVMFVLWPQASLVVQYDTGYGYHDGPVHNIPTPPAGSHLCSVWGYVWGPQENPKQYAVLTFTISDEAENSCDAVIMAHGPIRVETDVYGGFSKDLMQNDCLLNKETGNPTEWQVEVVWQDEFGQNRSKTASFYIPDDSTTYNLVF